jgi:hypothetical protein
MYERYVPARPIIGTPAISILLLVRVVSRPTPESTGSPAVIFAAVADGFLVPGGVRNKVLALGELAAGLACFLGFTDVGGISLGFWRRPIGSDLSGLLEERPSGNRARFIHVLPPVN